MLDFSWGWQYLLLLLATATILAKLMGLIIEVLHKPLVELTVHLHEVRERARYIAALPQRLQTVEVHPRGRVLILKIRASSDGMEQEWLSFSPKHPDFERLKALEGSSPFTLIHFEFVETALPGIDRNSVAAYLRLKVDYEALYRD